MTINNISEIKQYTVALYREKFGEPLQIGSGILVCFQSAYYLISAHHVFDMEEERLQVENDPDEADIPQDDMDGIMAKGSDFYFYINDNVKGIVCTAQYDEKTREILFNDDVEWCICELSTEVIRYLIENGKAFYKIDEAYSLKIHADSEIIVSGYPGYAHSDNQEVYRSYKSKLIETFTMNKNGLFRVRFDCSKAYCLEHEKEIQIPKAKGISGMSGGGLWYKVIDHYVPLGIIIKQDPNNNYIEGYGIAEILKFYIQENI